MEGPKLWDRTAQAVAEALDKDEVVQLTQTAGRAQAFVDEI